MGDELTEGINAATAFVSFQQKVEEIVNTLDNLVVNSIETETGDLQTSLDTAHVRITALRTRVEKLEGSPTDRQPGQGPR